MKPGFFLTLVTVILSAFATTAMAEHSFDGFYVGAHVGGSFGSASQRDNNTVTLNETSTPLIYPLVATANHANRYNHVTADVLLGYGGSCDCFYFGGEAFLKYSRYRARNQVQVSQPLSSAGIRVNIDNFSNTETRLRDLEYGIDLRPGFILHKTLSYLKLGFAINRLSLKSQGSGDVNLGFLGIALVVNSNETRRKNIVAPRIGFGIEQWLCECLAFRADYVYTYYGKISLSTTRMVNGTSINGGVIGQSSLTLADNTTVKLQSNAVTLGLSYYW